METYKKKSLMQQQRLLCLMSSLKQEAIVASRIVKSKTA